MNNYFKAFKESKYEIEKVIFPRKQQIIEAFFNVGMMVIFVSLFILFLDFAITNTISKVI